MDQKFWDFTESRKRHWNQLANNQIAPKWFRYSYHQRLQQIIKTIVPPNAGVIEIGCGPGELLDSLEPSFGVGLDFSHEMTKKAQKNFPDLHFITGDAHFLPTNQHYEYIILSDLLNDVWDIQSVLESIQHISFPETRIVINYFSRLWQPILTLARKLKLATPLLQQNWITIEDVRNLTKLCNFEIVQTKQEILFPVPHIGKIFNKILVKFWPINHLAITNVIVLRPIHKRWQAETPPSVSIIIPARNESGNIEHIFKRVPQMGGETELIFTEGHSTDDTYQEIKKQMSNFPQLKAHVYKQNGKGKGDAVRLGFKKAQGDILMILDADLSVPPEDLTRFYQAIIQNKGEFINGVRLIYPMEERAMKFLNLLGNKFFSIFFSWLLGQKIRDTLCGTKALWRMDYRIIAANRNYFGDADPFGDFDLILGAARCNLKFFEIPIRYRRREYGKTNIKRWKHGLLLLRMATYAAKKLKFL